MNKIVKVVYDATKPETEITADGKEFDTSRIKGKEIEDWAYPFMVRKVTWDGFYDEMVKALDGEKQFDLVFSGSEEALAELKEALGDAPVTIKQEAEDSGSVVVIEYDEKSLSTDITVNGEPFDTSRIKGREIEDWVYPFMMRKVKWNGIFEELSEVAGETYTIRFRGSDESLKELKEDCPENVTVISDNGKAKLSLRKASDTDWSEEAEDLEKQATEAFDNNGFEKAFELRLKASEMGNINSTVELSCQYRDGIGTEQNDSKALECFKKAADKGNAEAYNYLGCMYHSGRGCKKDDKKAFEYFMKAAEQNYAWGQYNVGQSYEYGWEVQENSYKAYEYYVKSADNNCGKACEKVGRFLDDGIGCEQDKDAAIKMWAKGDSLGDGNCAGWLGLKYLGTDNDNAYKMFRRAYEAGADEFWTYKLAQCYENGWGVQKNSYKAYEYYVESADNNCGAACEDVGLFLADGIGCEQDKDAAIKMWAKGDSLGNGNCAGLLGLKYFERDDYDNAYKMLYKAYEAGADDTYTYFLAACYKNGLGVQKNDRIAIQLFEEAAEEEPDGYDDIGMIYLNQRNYAFAVKYFQKAIDNGVTGGYTSLGLCYANGYGVVKDKEKAKKLLQVAIDQGDKEAAKIYNDIIKKEGYIDMAKKAGKELLELFMT